MSKGYPIILYQFDETHYEGCVEAGFRIDVDGQVFQFKNKFPDEMSIREVFDLLKKKADIELKEGRE